MLHVLFDQNEMYHRNGCRIQVCSIDNSSFRLIIYSEQRANRKLLPRIARQTRNNHNNNNNNNQYG